MATARSFIGKSWHITCVGTGYDGVKFGKVFEFLKINQFEGAREITSLKAYPLRYHPQETRIRHQLLERGKRFLELRGRQHMSYKGRNLWWILVSLLSSYVILTSNG
jgi:hypothetical protein